MFGVCTKCGNAKILSEPCPTCGEGPPALQRPAMAQAVMARPVLARPVASRPTVSDNTDVSGQTLDVEAMVAEINASVAAETHTHSLRDHAKTFLGIGGLLLAFAAAWAVQNLMFLRTAVPVTGIAVSEMDSFWARGRTRTYCVVRYHADGQTWETTVRHRYVGEEVELLVSPSDPTNVCDSSPGGLWGWPIFLTVLGGTAILTGASWIVSAKPRMEY